MRVGTGYDVHPLVAGRPLVLGGVEIPHEQGLEGHSDGDVLCHAVIDALLGAAALGDIGQRFPSDDQSLRGARSLDLLKTTVSLVAKAGYRVANVDSTVVAEAPKLAPHVPRMREVLAAALGVEPSTVSIKATTSDALGMIGRGEGIAALAVVLIDST